MRFKFLSLVAIVALLGACETAPESSGAASGAGAGAPTTTGTGTTGGTTASPSRPTGPAAGSKGDFVANVGDRVFFDFDKYSIKADGRQTLVRQAVWLKKYPGVTITIEGHCDERGTREYNLALGERRANAVKDYLVASGISPSRIKTISYGKERPQARGSNESAWAQNRRGVTVLKGAGT
jgi:peptidoglycan-associated lipoprotein